MEQDTRRLAAIMFTDITRYAAITQNNETLALELLKEHNAILRSIFIRWKGHEVKSVGDSFLIEFVNVLDSVNCAIDIQEALHKRNQSVSPERKFQIRIGIHVGDVVYRDNDVFGDGVNIASRVMQLSEPDGICLTEDVVRQVRNKIDVPVVSLGLGELKNIKLEVAIYKILLPWKQKKLSIAEKTGRVLRTKTFRWCAIGTALLAVGFFVLSKKGNINLSAGELKLNPEMKFTEIKIPFKNEGAPGFSDDGNLMAFSAPDLNGKYDIYLMYISTNQYKRITFDSSDVSSDVVLSRDGSLILEQKTSRADLLELSLISSLGNGKKVVLANGSSLARFRPDNQIIGFIKPETHDTPKEFWTVRPDGTERKLIFTDSAGGYHSFAWSPDGKRIAWIKSFNEDTARYEEIVIRELSTGEEKQLTNLKSPIYEVEWSDDNMIYFTLTGQNVGNDFRGKEYDLWMVSETGGKPLRVTRGSGADNVIRFANKVNRMFIHKRDDKLVLKTADLDGVNQKQILFDELNYYYAYFEDNDRIIAQRNNGQHRELVRVNTISGEVEVLFTPRIANSIFYYSRPVSPGSIMFAFGEIALSPERMPDTCITYCCDKNYQNIHPIGAGLPEFWIDDDKLVMNKLDPVSKQFRHGFIYSISSSSYERFYDTTSIVLPIFNKNTILVFDSTEVRYSVFNSKESMGNYLRNGGSEKFKPFIIPKGMYIEPTSFLLLTDPNTADKYFAYTIPEFQKIEIGNLPRVYTWNLSEDFKKVVYTALESTSEVTAIDNIIPE